jgi:hypothetical protein
MNICEIYNLFLYLKPKKKGGGNIISFCSILFKQQMYEKLLKQNITCSKLPICSFNNMENTIL